ncbi:MAG: hypothetical protein L6R37_007618, partial [Teloschistes peruensis]
GARLADANLDTGGLQLLCPFSPGNPPHLQRAHPPPLPLSYSKGLGAATQANPQYRHSSM